jgi:hypothetical protein
VSLTVAANIGVKAQGADLAIVFSEQPSILVQIGGQPVYQAVEGTGLQRIVNTSPFIVRDEAGIYYMKVFDGWMEAYDLTGLWSVSGAAPRGAEQALRQAVTQQTVDLLIGASPAQRDDRPSLDAGAVPEIVVSTEPAVLIVTDGPPRFVKVEGSALEYVENTTANVFKEPTDDELYVRTGGRWFRSWTTDGPWEFVPDRELPTDIAACDRWRSSGS